jgi:RNA-directed DNA polymerase
MPSQSLVRALARAFLAGEQSVERVVVRGGRTLGDDWRWLRPLARRYVKAFARRTRPRHRDVVQFLLQGRGFLQISSRYFHELPVAHWLTEPQQMKPVEAASTWDVPAIESVGSLADWLRITLGDLEWFADLKGRGYKKSSQQLRHYHYRILAKQSGSIRLIEAPKARLKGIQRQILAQILDKVPPHPAAHGFLKGRSIRTFIAPHVGQRVLLRIDLRDFFPSFAAARIQAFFRTLGYPEAVADLLGGICTNAASRDVWNREAFGEDPLHLWERCGEARDLYSHPHCRRAHPLHRRLPIFVPTARIAA